VRADGQLERSELYLPASLRNTCACEAHGAHFETSTVWPKWSNKVAKWHGCGGTGGGASISGSPTGLHPEGGGTAILRNITIYSPHIVCRQDDR
jgi:hypothetical protein